MGGAKLKKPRLDLKAVKKAIEDKLHMNRDPTFFVDGSLQKKIDKREWVKTGVTGFDALLYKGIPKRSSVLICGGPGSGKTIFCLQSLASAMAQGKKCLYMSFEESEERLIEHMEDFGWDARKYIKSGHLIIKRYNPYDVTRQVEAMLEKAKGELLIDIKPMIFPRGFSPDRVIVDSLSAIASAFVNKEDTYRIYIEQLFRIFEDVDATAFLISETSELPKLTPSGVEEFLADGVIVIYNVKHGNVRESAIECLKLRGAAFKKKIVAMKIMGGRGIEVYPEQEIFSSMP